MSADVIDGKAFAAALRAKVAGAAGRFRDLTGRPPGLAVVLVGEDGPSSIYVRSKARATLEAGMNGIVHRLDAHASQDALLDLVASLNADDVIDGILVQLPLPPQIGEAAVIAAVDPTKDVDGFHPVNAGRLATGQTALVPCTPLGCLLLLQNRLGDLSGLDAVVIGRSNIVGKPMAALLLGANCTVTIAHSRTRDLPDVVRRADIVVAAVGRAEMVRGDWIKPGATVIDVGINRVDGKLVGDVAYDEAARTAGAITPVPGGVGPMTIAVLLRNTLFAAHARAGMTAPEGLA